MNVCDPALAPTASVPAPHLLLPEAFKRSSHRSDPPISWARGVLVVDVAAVAVSLLGVAVMANVTPATSSIHTLLSLQVSVKMVVLLAAVLVLWPAVLTACGLY